MPSLEDRERAFAKGPNQLEPFDIWPGDTNRMPPFPFPCLEKFTSQRWKLVRTYNIAAMPITEFILNIKVGRGYVFFSDMEDIPVGGLIGEYKYASSKLD